MHTWSGDHVWLLIKLLKLPGIRNIYNIFRWNKWVLFWTWGSLTVDQRTTSLQLVRLRPGQFREVFWCADGTCRGFCAHHVEAIVTELGGKSAEEDEKEHYERPLAASCRHGDVLRQQKGVYTRWVKVKTWKLRIRAGWKWMWQPVSWYCQAAACAVA